ncbi:alpha/beta fold hydrolase [Microbacterium suaedae]|uniref:alpha/beta fold hydrolase n=1 Tax=Microbacterium suaedae TaxID=2067813 RepID=UPI000DA185C6|nr:alpha/beta fold hydrolase [Microbacterium suaedae]
MTHPLLSIDRHVGRDVAERDPVVLLHGFGSSGRADWPHDEWVDPFVAAGRDVFAVDLPGHGSAPPTGGPVALSAVLDELADLVRSAGRHAVIVGYSLGARLAWGLAARADVPVSRLALGGLSPVEPFAAVDVPAARAALAGGPEPADELSRMILRMARSSDGDPASLIDLVDGFAADPFDSSSSAPTVPVLLIAGEEDPMATGGEALVQRLEGGVFRTLPGDHRGVLRSAAFRHAVMEFLG